MQIETQIIERLKRIAKRMLHAQEATLLYEFDQIYERNQITEATRINNLLGLGDMIRTCQIAREIKAKIKSKKNLQTEDYLRIAIELVAISKKLYEDDYKRVFRETVWNSELEMVLYQAYDKTKLREEAKEMLWFITEGAPLHYWTEIDAKTEQQDCWSFHLVKTEEEFQSLIRCGKRELRYEKFCHIRVCYGTKSMYCNLEEKETFCHQFQRIAIEEGKEEFYNGAIDILFPDKYTTGNYYIYIPPTMN